MNLISRAGNAWDALVGREKALPLMSARGGWGAWSYDHEHHTGDWQRDIPIEQGKVLANWALFSCLTLIAGDIGKVRIGLSEERETPSGSIWIEAFSASFTPVLKRPNRYQTWQQFAEQWVISKLSNGNTYVLLQRDRRQVVVAMYVLDPCLVLPLVTDEGYVYYQLGQDNLSGLKESVPGVPASEVIHDRFNCLFHPLVGLSPIYACGLAAMQGLKIQQNSAKFFRNMSRPSGILTGPTKISDETAKRLKDHWERNYTGDNMGKVAVLGDGLKYEGMMVTPVDAQMVEQLSATAEMICSTFHVPAFKIGAGTIPAGQKVEDLNQIYYSDCLHALMDAMQTLLTYGLGLEEPKDGKKYAVRFDLDDLLKMDTATKVKTVADAISAGYLKIDEGRAKFNMAPVEGGNTPYLQQQNYALAALARRDAQADPFAPSNPPAPPPEPPDTPDDGEPDDAEKRMIAMHKDVQALVQRMTDDAEARAAEVRAKTQADLQVKEFAALLSAEFEDV